MDFLEGLNPEQREAVCHLEGPLLILAGAGSGKTRVITHRAARLVGVHRVDPRALAAVTFTNKAADEMRTRLSQMLAGAGAASTPWISTFHSLCVRLLRQDGASLAALRPGFTRDFTICGEEDQLAVVKSVFRRHGLDEQFMPYRSAVSRISFAKNQRQTAADLYNSATDPNTSRLALIWEEYDGTLRRSNALDFDDLLLETVRLLKHDDTVRLAWNRRLEYLMIDEYQDTNRSQYELMCLLSQHRRNVCVVGDEDQSIYSWRGADIRNILDFERDFLDARVIRLEQNYRSTKCILAAAGAVVARNTQRIGKSLWSDGEEGPRVGLFEAWDGEQEALFIADTTRSILVEDPASRVAVLYRTNFQSRQIEEALRRYGLSYIVLGGFSFYQRAEVKDALAYLKLLLSPADSISLLRVINTPARGIGRTTVEQLERFAFEHQIPVWAAIGRMLEENLLSTRAAASLAAFRTMIEALREDGAADPPHVVLERILERTGYLRTLQSDPSPGSESRVENLNELVNAAAEAAERGENTAEFLDHAALASDTDLYDEGAQISLLTLHNAKGLEFPVVFIAGLEERLFPHSRSAGSEAMLEEERRLFYVGMTRARRRLILTWAGKRRRFGGGDPEPCTPSRFLAEVPESVTEDLAKSLKTPSLDLFAERHEVRDRARRSTYTGKTYNSVEHIRDFFAGGGGQAVQPAVPAPKPAPPRRRPAAGATIAHPRFGKGTVIRREGEGDEAKITVSFPRYGLKKIMEKYAVFDKDE